MKFSKLIIIALLLLSTIGFASAASTYNLNLDYQSAQTAYFPSSVNMTAATGMTVAATSTYPEANPYDIPADGLVAWWKFDEVAGTTVADAAGSNDGTASGGMGRTNGKYNQAGSFDGSDDYVTIADPLAGATACTVVCWVYRNTYQYASGFISEWNTTTNPSTSRVFWLGCEYPEGTLYWAINNSTATKSVTKTGFTGGEWHMVVGTFDSSTDSMSIWIDLSKATTTTTFNALSPTPSTHTRIGQSGYSATGLLNGYIDNVLIYNRALSDEEITQLYYDTVADLKVKTDTLDTWSSFIYGEGSAVSVPFANNSTMTGLIADIPDSVTIDTITVYDYTKTVSPMTLTATVNWQAGTSGGTGDTGEYVDITGNISNVNQTGNATEIQEHTPAAPGNYSRYVGVLFQRNMSVWDYAENNVTFYTDFVEASFFWLIILLIPMITMWQRQGTVIIVCVIYLFCGAIFAQVLPAYFAGAQLAFLVLGAGGIIYKMFVKGD